jgi:hypothetical protein
MSTLAITASHLSGGRVRCKGKCCSLWLERGDSQCVVFVYDRGFLRFLYLQSIYTAPCCNSFISNPLSDSWWDDRSGVVLS